MSKRRCTLILANATIADLPFLVGDLIAVDAGAKFALKHHLKLKLAIGDFDSLPKPAQNQLRRNHIPLLAFEAHKDQSDAELALAWALAQDYQDIRVIGFSDGRLDHYQSIIQRVFALKNSKIILRNQQNIIVYLGQGKHRLIPIKAFRYFSLFTFDDAEVSLLHARYPLTNVTLRAKDTYTLSNEWVDGIPVELTIHRGGVLLFTTRG